MRPLQSPGKRDAGNSAVLVSVRTFPLPPFALTSVFKDSSGQEKVFALFQLIRRGRSILNHRHRLFPTFLVVVVVRRRVRLNVCFYSVSERSEFVRPGLLVGVLLASIMHQDNAAASFYQQLTGVPAHTEEDSRREAKRMELQNRKKMRKGNLSPVITANSNSRYPESDV